MAITPWVFVVRFACHIKTVLTHQPSYQAWKSILATWTRVWCWKTLKNIEKSSWSCQGVWCSCFTWCRNPGYHECAAWILTTARQRRGLCDTRNSVPWICPPEAQPETSVDDKAMKVCLQTEYKAIGYPRILIVIKIWSHYPRIATGYLMWPGQTALFNA